MTDSANATIGKSPTEMVFSTTLHLFPSPGDLAKPKQDVPAVTDYIQKIQDNIAITRGRHSKAKTKQTTYANKKQHPEPDYKVGVRRADRRRERQVRARPNKERISRDGLAMARQ